MTYEGILKVCDEEKFKELLVAVSGVEKLMEWDCLPLFIYNCSYISSRMR